MGHTERWMKSRMSLGNWRRKEPVCCRPNYVQLPLAQTAADLRHCSRLGPADYLQGFAVSPRSQGICELLVYFRCQAKVWGVLCDYWLLSNFPHSSLSVSALDAPHLRSPWPSRTMFTNSGHSSFLSRSRIQFFGFTNLIRAVGFS